MKKKLTAILLALALVFCGCEKAPNQETTAPPETEPSAPIQTETVYVLTRLTALDENGTERWHMDYTYDDQGRCIGQTEILYSGEISWYCTITYVWEGNDLLITTTQPSGDASTCRETYDEDRNLIRQQRGLERTEYTYDEAGNLLIKEESSGGDPGVSRIEYTYDEQGRKITSYSYRNGNLVGRTEFTYDDQGRLAGTRSYDENDALSGYTECTWEGNVCTERQYLPDGTHYFTVTTTYDEGGRAIRIEQNNGYMSSAKEYTYEPIEIKP